MKNFIGKGKFIVFEGGEACGKSTQINLLKKQLSNKNFIFTREPGGTKIADEIREIIVTGSKDKLLPKTELALIYAARNEHLNKVILPNLEAGINVISDRFNLSTYIYQGQAENLGHELIDKFNQLFLNNFSPDLTYIFDIDQETANKRIEKRNNINERFEKFPAEFHQKIRESFLEYSKKTENCRVIDAKEAIEAINQKLISEITKFTKN